MNGLGFLLSLLFHGALVAAMIFWVPSTPKPLNLEAVYQVDLLSLAPPAPAVEPVPAPPVPEPEAPTPEPEPESPASESEPEAVPEPPKSEPVPEPPKPEPPKPEPKPEAISPKKVEKKVVKKKSEPKSEPKTKPQPKKSAKELLSEGLSDLRKTTKKPAKKPGNLLNQELAALRKDAQSQSQQGGMPGGQGQSSGLAAVYGLIVGKEIKKNWRYPSFAGDVNILVTVEVNIDDQGIIRSQRIVKSSGNAEFDSSAIRAVKETKQVTPPSTVRDRVLRVNFNSQELNQ